MKTKMIAALCLCCIALCGCSRMGQAPRTDDTEKPGETTETEQNEETEEAEEYLIPENYLNFYGGTAEELAGDFRDLGAEYCTEAETTEEGVKLWLTEEQRDSLIQRNEENMNSQIAPYLAENEAYELVPDPSWHKMTLYFDEELPEDEAGRLMTAGISTYILNQILQDHTSEWSLEVTVYNCHTGKVAMSVNLPEETAYLDDEAWAASYEE